MVGCRHNLAQNFPVVSFNKSLLKDWLLQSRVVPTRPPTASISAVYGHLRAGQGSYCMLKNYGWQLFLFCEWYSSFLIWLTPESQGMQTFCPVLFLQCNFAAHLKGLQIACITFCVFQRNLVPTNICIWGAVNNVLGPAADHKSSMF